MVGPWFVGAGLTGSGLAEGWWRSENLLAVEQQKGEQTARFRFPFAQLTFISIFISVLRRSISLSRSWARLTAWLGPSEDPGSALGRSETEQEDVYVGAFVLEFLFKYRGVLF